MSFLLATNIHDLRAQAPECHENAYITVGNASGGISDQVTVDLRGGSICDVTGFGLAIGHDFTQLDFLNAIPGSFLFDHAGRDLLPVVFDGTGYFKLFVAFDLSFPLTVPPTSIPDDTLLATLVYRVRPTARPGNVVTLMNEDKAFGTPPTANIYTTEELAIEPVLNSGSITILGGQVDCGANSELSVGQASGAPGAQVQVQLRGSTVCDVNGFGLAIGHDANRVEFLSADPGPFLVNYAGSQLGFVSEPRNSAGYAQLFVLFDFTQPITVPPTSIPSGTVLATLTYSILPGAPSGQVPLQNADRTFGFPLVDNAYSTAEGTLIRPQLQSGSITVGAGGPVDCSDSASLEVGSVSGLPDSIVQVDLVGSSACDVTGFSVAIGHDNTRVELIGATPSQFLNLHAGSDLFFDPEERNAEGFVALFVAFDLSDPVTVPPTPIFPNTTLATLQYRILPGAAPGEVTLRNEDRAFGFPPIPALYSTGGILSIRPQLQSGSITVLGGPIDCDAESSLSLGSAIAASGEVQVELRGHSACEVSGLELAIGHDPSRVEFVRATPGPLLTSHGGSQLVFAAEENRTAGYTSILAAFDGSFPFTVPARDIPADTLLATLTYRILPGADPGSVVLRNLDRTFGSPLIDNVFTSSTGAIRPALTSGVITIEPQQTGFSMRIEAPGIAQFMAEPFEVEVLGSATRGLIGYSALIEYDPAAVSLLSGDFTNTVWEDADFQQFRDTGGEIRVGVVLDEDGIAPPAATVVPPGEDLRFLSLLFAGNCPGATSIDFIGGIDDNLLVDEDIGGHDPGNGLGLSGATVSLEGGFVRGNANGGPVDPADPAASVDLADGLFILQHLFMDGAPPSCHDAADANDDGRLNLIDPISIFQFLIGNRGSTLPAPFTAAGVDPTPDELRCDLFSDSQGCEQ